MKLDGKRVCFYLDESMTVLHEDDGTHHYYPAIVTEDEGGYHRTDWDYGTDYKLARQAVDELNAERGYTQSEVYKIVASSMRAPFVA